MFVEENNVNSKSPEGTGVCECGNKAETKIDGEAVCYLCAKMNYKKIYQEERSKKGNKHRKVRDRYFR